VAEARIGRDGTIFLPFLGRVSVQDRTPRELGAHVETLLAERGYLRFPQVHVEVRERSGKRAFVLGRVGRPGAYDLPFHEDLTLTQLVALAGGLSLYRSERSDIEADPSAVRLIRTVESERTVYTIDFGAIMTGDLAADVAIQDQDVVYVPPKRALFVFGSVRLPGNYPMANRSRIGVDEALALAGGFVEDADRIRLLLVRRGPEGARTYRVPTDPTERAAVELTAGDTLIVPSRSVRRVYILGQVGRQGGVPLDEPDMTVTQVLALSGGLERIAAANSVRLIRRAPDGSKRVYRVPVADIISSGDLERDPVLLPGDLIWVPEGLF